jgi:methionyl-tRNA formyltransferase
MKIAFFGTAEFSQSILKSLLENFHKELEVVCAISQEDKPVGRDKVITKTPVKIQAEDAHIPLFQPSKLR